MSGSQTFPSYQDQPGAAIPAYATAQRNALNITTATVVKASPGTVVAVTVVVAGSSIGAVYDSTSASGNTTADQAATIPEAVGTYNFNFPCLEGIVVSPGAGQTLAVAFS